MNEGCSVWIRNPHYEDLFSADLWLPGTVLSKTTTNKGDTALLVSRVAHHAAGTPEEMTFTIPQGSVETEDVKFRNDVHNFGTVENLDELCFLNEPEILAALKARYFKSVFSCYLGPILLHTNPLSSQVNPTDEILEEFSHDVKEQTNLPPDLWETATAVLKEAIGKESGHGRRSYASSDASSGEKQLKIDKDGVNHSILISGEAGSGKTEASKQVLRYLLKQSVTKSMKLTQQQMSTLNSLGSVEFRQELMKTLSESGSSSAKDGGFADALADVPRVASESQYGDNFSKSYSRSEMIARVKTRSFAFYNTLQLDIMEKIINANVILEAMGNAKLLRNKNSSRYGKYVEVGFNKTGALVGGMVRTYLLENARVCYQLAEEHNFHIFYQLVRGSGGIERMRYGLSSDIEQYHYLNQGLGTAGRDIDDNADFESLSESFQFLEVNEELKEEFLGVIAGLLHLGNITFQSVYDSSGESCYVVDRAPLLQVSKLLGLQIEDLERALTRRSTMVIRGEAITKSMTTAQAAAARDAVAKHVYKRVFIWLVDTINEKLKPEEEAGALTSSVGILDIFGFENLAKNSFDQLCINYAAETLQQHFNEAAFKFEVVEYEKEGMQYDSLTFRTYEDVTELIGTGILSLLDDQCRLPNPSDKKFAAKLCIKFENHPFFKASTTELRDSMFTILHFAGEVHYSSDGFIEKNIDDLPAIAESMIMKSTTEMLRAPDADDEDEDNAPNRFVTSKPQQLHQQKHNIGSQFRAQLQHLVKQLKQTVPHFIRCIKSSDKPRRRETQTGATAPSSKNSFAPNNPAVLNAAQEALMAPSHTKRGSHVSAPNRVQITDKAPFNQRKVAEQLRSGGIIEAVRVARVHYFAKLSHFEFYHRYRCCVRYDHPNAKSLPKSVARNIKKRELHQLCNLLLETLPNNPLVTVQRKVRGKINTVTVSESRMGITTAFITRSDYELLENGRHEQVNEARRIIFQFVSFGKQRAWFKKARRSVMLLQRAERGRRARRFVRAQRKQLFAIISIQRRFHSRKYLQSIFKALKFLRDHMIVIQKYARRFIAKLFIVRLKQAKELYALTFGNLLVAKDIRVARRSNIGQPPPVPIMEVEGKIVQFRNNEVSLLTDINRMIASTKVASQDALVRFDVEESRRILSEWGQQISAGPLRNVLMRIAHKIDLGHKMLSAERLIPLRGISAIVKLTCKMPVETRTQSVKQAKKRITKSHKIFESIKRLQVLLEELLRVAFKERKAAIAHIETIKKDLVANIRKFGADFQRSKAAPYYVEIQSIKEFIALTDNIMRFGLVLYRYYQGYVKLIVKEYGEKSAYRSDFGDDELYLLSLAQLIEQNQPLHYAEQYLHMTNPDPDMDVCANFPLKLFSDAKNRIQLYEGVYYRFMPFAPGIDFTSNSFQQFFVPPALTPARLIRISGKSADNYGQEAYYQASVNLSSDNMVDVLANPVFIEKLHYPTLSAMILTSLLTGAGDCRPENVMVRFVREDETDPESDISRIDLLGIAGDEVYRRTAFDYNRLAEPFNYCQAPSGAMLLNHGGASATYHGLGLNVLYFLPQMDEAIDMEIVNFLLRSKTVPEEIVCTWLKFLHQQNKRYEALRQTGGFTTEDFGNLKLPIQLALGTAIRIHQRLAELRERLVAEKEAQAATVAAMERGEDVRHSSSFMHYHNRHSKSSYSLGTAKSKHVAPGMTHAALLHFWYPQLSEYYQTWRVSKNDNIPPTNSQDGDSRRHSRSRAAMSLSDSGSDDESEVHQISESGSRSNSQRGGMSRTGSRPGSGKVDFGGLTPFHRLYYDAMRALETEAAILRNSGHFTVPTLDSHSEEEASATGPGETPRGSERQPSMRASKSKSSRLTRSVSKNKNEESGSVFLANSGSFKFDKIYADSEDEADEDYYEYEGRPDAENTVRNSTSFNMLDMYDRNSVREVGLSPDAKRGKRPMSIQTEGLDADSRQLERKSSGASKLSVTPAAGDGDGPGRRRRTVDEVIAGDNPLAKLRPDTRGSATNAGKSFNDKSPKEADAIAGENPLAARRMPRKTAPPQLENRVPSFAVAVGTGEEEVDMNNIYGDGDPMDEVEAMKNADNEDDDDEEDEDDYDEEDDEEDEEEEDEEESEEDTVGISAAELSDHAEIMRDFDDEDDEDEEDDSSDEEDEAVTAATMSTIDDVALQFLMSIDFRRFSKEDSPRICRIIGDTLSFLETLWLRYVTEEQLMHMFEGYYEQKRLHRLANAVANGRAAQDKSAASSGRGDAIDALSNLTPEEKEQLASGVALGKDEVEIYSVKEVKLIGIAPHMFKLLQRTPTVRKMRRNLGISVSLVVLMGTDSSFEDVLSEETKQQLVGEDGAPLPAVEYDSDDDEVENPALHAAVDNPERYETLKSRAKLAVRSYTSMVHSRSPEQISNDIAIINEVVRIAANERAIRRMDMELIQRFVYIFLDFPGLARLGKELAERGLFLRTQRIIHHLLAHNIIERYLDTMDAIVRKNPSCLLLKDADGTFMPCDRVKALPDGKYFKYKMFCAFVNLIPMINDERRRRAGDVAVAAASKAKKKMMAGRGAVSVDEDDSDIRAKAEAEVQLLRGDENFLSQYSGDEELIFRAVHYGLRASEAELKEKLFNVHKSDTTTGESIFHKCAADWANRPKGPALSTFKMALKTLQTRVINASVTQLEAEKMLFQKRTKIEGQQHTVWELLTSVNANRMMDLIALEWCKCGKSSGAPTAALTRNPSATVLLQPSAITPQSSFSMPSINKGPSGSVKTMMRASPSSVLAAKPTALVEEDNDAAAIVSDEYRNLDADGVVELNSMHSGSNYNYEEDDGADMAAAGSKGYGTEEDDAGAVLEQKSSTLGNLEVDDVTIEMAQ